ncbi:putative type VI secretion system effector [Enterobacter quasiroggenkampii]|uniref:putative type VI secretion system effector n=1 Tax=Enterobacter quasiroggenkampii TaxID=2497436 RepID=UPI001F41CA6F|nr:putative type VI secretion system effector [Enterobacter quasiroggenkampii]
MNSVENQQVCSRFVEPEKLADLRIKQEIEVMNGRPWTRKLPPPPVLPPYGPLEKISGHLEAFRYERFREYFGADSYRTHSVPAITDGQRGAVAAAAIVAGSPGVGAVMMAESESSNEYVQGMINGKPFRGWVGVTRVQAGDDVDMIVEWQHDHYEVYAIVLPEERIVSICPKCDRGHIAHMLWRIKNMFILTAIIMFMFACVCLVKSLNEEGWGQLDFWKEYFVFLMMMLGLAFIFTGAIAIAAYKACSSTCCRLTEEIFQLLEMKDVTRVNLKEITKKREKLQRKKGKWHEPSSRSHTPRPTRKFGYLFEHWYYY